MKVSLKSVVLASVDQVCFVLFFFSVFILSHKDLARQVYGDYIEQRTIKTGRFSYSFLSLPIVNLNFTLAFHWDNRGKYFRWILDGESLTTTLAAVSKNLTHVVCRFQSFVALIRKYSFVHEEVTKVVLL